MGVPSKLFSQRNLGRRSSGDDSTLGLGGVSDSVGRRSGGSFVLGSLRFQLGKLGLGFGVKCAFAHLKSKSDLFDLEPTGFDFELSITLRAVLADGSFDAALEGRAEVLHQDDDHTDGRYRPD